MPARVDFDIKVAGLEELVQGLKDLQGQALAKVIADSLRRSARGVVVPAMRRQMAADFKRTGSHQSKVKPARGQAGPAERNVTVRTVRRRSGEVVALSIGPRAWYSHFPIGGTKPHVITARGLSARQVRQLNRGTAPRALVIGSRFLAKVNHPGSRGTDSVTKAARGVTDQLNARYVSDLQKAYDKHLAGPTRRARPKTP